MPLKTKISYHTQEIRDSVGSYDKLSTHMNEIYYGDDSEFTGVKFLNPFVVRHDDGNYIIQPAISQIFTEE